MSEIYAPLPKEEVRKAVERRGPTRIPLVMAKWWGEGLYRQYGERIRQFDVYPDDVMRVMIDPLDPETMDLSWKVPEQKARDKRGVLTDWKHLDEFIAKMPDPNAPGLFDELCRQAEVAHRQDRYLLFGWWRLFFERPWALRGMDNLMVDYYIHPEQVQRLHAALCELYVGLIERAVRELQPDGVFTSDDLGNQRQLMVSPAIFREFMKPYYKEVGEACRKSNLHFWLHSCGNNTEVLEDLIECGLTVFHPVQKHTMDEAVIASDFGDRLAFLVGFDVQHLLQEGSPAEVREEVRYLIDTFDGPGGGMCMAAGNGIVGGTPIENIEAFLDESLRYGALHRANYGR